MCDIGLTSNMIEYKLIQQLVFIVSVIAFPPAKQLQLKTLSVVFRHGDREPIRLFLNEPKEEYSFYPLQLGELTNAGKRREYQLGHLLRQKYNDFLGPYYIPSDVFGISTDVHRTKMSLLLVLASLYPPVRKQVWKNNLNWQPVSSFGNLPGNLDPILSFIVNCPTYVTEYNRVRNSPQFEELSSKFDNVFRNLTQLTGKTFNSTTELYFLYQSLEAETSMNVRLPDWTKQYFPNGATLDAALLVYHLQSYNTLLKRLNGGSTIRLILNTIMQFPNATKLNLYSAHEVNIAGLLQTLNTWDYVPPHYSSAVLFEHHENDSQKFIKVLHYKGIPDKFEELTIPGCTTMCPLEDFIRITKDVIPDDPIEECYGPPSNSQLVPEGQDPIEWFYGVLRHWYSTSLSTKII